MIERALQTTRHASLQGAFGAAIRIDDDEKLGARISARARRQSMKLNDNLESEEGEAEGWITTYMDLITLLLAFFIVMLSLATFVRPFSAAGPSPEPVAVEGPSSVGAATAPSADRFRALAASLRGAFDPGLLAAGDVAVAAVSDAVIIDISGPVMFGDSATTLTDEGYAVVDNLAFQLVLSRFFEGRTPFITVEGHTDDRPIRSTLLASNWELSAARAAAVVRRLIGQGVTPKRLRAVGYAHLHPRASNKTPEGRARNRRVSLVIHESGLSPRAAGQF
jgi:chemotaxis protein MotB